MSRRSTVPPLRTPEAGGKTSHQEQGTRIQRDALAIFILHSEQLRRQERQNREAITLTDGSAGAHVP